MAFLNLIARLNSIYLYYKPGGLVVLRAAIRALSLFAHWAFCSTVYYVWRNFFHALSTMARQGYGIAGSISSLITLGLSAPSTSSRAIVTLLKKDASGELVPVMLLNGTSVSLFSTALQLPLSEEIGVYAPRLLFNLEHALDIALGSFFTFVIYSVFQIVIRLLHKAISARNPGNSTLSPEPTLRAEEIDTEPQNFAICANGTNDAPQYGSDESFSLCRENRAIDIITDEQSASLYCNETISSPVPSTATSDGLSSEESHFSKLESHTLVSAAQDVTHENLADLSRSSFSENTPTKPAVSLNPTANVFTPKRATRVESSPVSLPGLLIDVAGGSGPSTPVSIGPITPPSAPPPRAIPTHFTRRPPQPSPLARFASSYEKQSFPTPFRHADRSNSFAYALHEMQSAPRAWGRDPRNSLREPDMFY